MRDTTKSYKVAILGGGMGGLACAHELAREGVEVTVYEAGHAIGGKARSHYLPGTGTHGRRDLPGEHGFRFYPGFYRHVIATMDEIADPESPSGAVSGNLASAHEAGVARPGAGVVVSPRRAHSLADLRRLADGLARSGGDLPALLRYLAAHLKYLTACDARRDGEIEASSWAAFIGADQPGRYPEAFRQVLLACTRTMVAMDAERGSARTVGQASSMLLLDAFGRGPVDRTMMGPTSECWLDPWQAHLERAGVRFHFGARVDGLELCSRRITRAFARHGDGRRAAIDADAYVLAVPLEVAHRLITPALADADRELANIRRCDLDTSTSWMTGAQFFLREDVPLCAGHLFLPESPWSLTAISQAQFWDRGQRGMSRYGDGRLRGILSVDISSCFTRDADGVRLVDETSRPGVLRRVRDQLLAALDAPTRALLARSIYAAKLDDELQVGPRGVHNAARLLVHPPGSRALRPAADTSLANLHIAADYVQTSMDLASMEGANEAGRRAARGLLTRAGLDATRVQLFAYDELDRFPLLRRLDAWLHARGLPHLHDLLADPTRRHPRALAPAPHTTPIPAAA